MRYRGARGRGRVVLGTDFVSRAPRPAPVTLAGRGRGVTNPNVMETRSVLTEVRYELRCKKTNLWGFQPCQTKNR